MRDKREHPQRPILLAAGGTGGHLFPAAALAHALRSRGFAIHLVTDERAAKYVSDFPAHAIHKVAAASPSGGSLASRMTALVTLVKGIFAARGLIKRLNPCAVVGFGGYATVPPLLAASWLGVPTIVHEANAVIGRANRFLAPRVDAIAKGFLKLGGLPARLEAKTHLTGNPVRPMVIDAARLPFPDCSSGKLRVLVTGGSQGARIFSDVVPAAVAHLCNELARGAFDRRQLIIVQQARTEDVERVREAYRKLGVEAEVEPFFPDLPQRIAEAHLVIARAGASTIAELAVIGRPAILVPLPHALDQDQMANAAHFAATGAAMVEPQSVFSPQCLATWLFELLGGFQIKGEGGMTVLERKAAAAKRAGIPDAAERLASLVQGFVSDEDKLNEVAR